MQRHTRSSRGATRLLLLLGLSLCLVALFTAPTSARAQETDEVPPSPAPSPPPTVTFAEDVVMEIDAASDLPPPPVEPETVPVSPAEVAVEEVVVEGIDLAAAPEESAAVAPAEDIGEVPSVSENEEEEADVEDAASRPEDYLDALTDDELKKMVFDLSGGKIKVEKFKTRQELLDAVERAEKADEARRIFEARVKTALKRQRAADGVTGEEAEGEEEEHHAVAGHGRRRHGRRNRLATEAQIPQEEAEEGQAAGGWKPMEGRPLHASAHSHHVHFIYCRASGYQRDVKAMEEKLNETLPNIEDIAFSEEPSPVPITKQRISSVLKGCFMAALFMGTMGERLPLPQPIIRFIQTRRGFVVSTGVTLNILGGAVTQTGAFEILVDGQVVYSRLATKRMPTPDEARQLILEKTLLKDYNA